MSSDTTETVPEAVVAAVTYDIPQVRQAFREALADPDARAALLDALDAVPRENRDELARNWERSWLASEARANHYREALETIQRRYGVAIALTPSVADSMAKVARAALES